MFQTTNQSCCYFIMFGCHFITFSAGFTQPEKVLLSYDCYDHHSKWD